VKTEGFISASGHALENLVATEETWKTILDDLPDELRPGLFFERDCWTYFRDPACLQSVIPLRIAGAPVIIPVYTPPILHAGTISPDDPHKNLIDPRTDISDETICQLLQCFPFARGFYILYNGYLQVWVDTEFDFRHNASTLPRRFGSLKVSFFIQGPSPNSSLGNGYVSAMSSGNTPAMVCGGEIEVRHKTPADQPVRSCIGVAVEISGEIFVTMASHAAVPPPPMTKYPKTKALFKRLGQSKTELAKGRPPNKWWEGVEIFVPGNIQKVSIYYSFKINKPMPTSVYACRWAIYSKHTMKMSQTIPHFLPASGMIYH
jgi:hypothetical protein